MDIEEKKLTISSQIQSSICSQNPLIYHIIPAIATEQVMQAEVNNYFSPNIKTNEKDPQQLQASLQGHKLKGRTNTVQNTYEACLIKDDGNIEMCLLQPIQQVAEWRKDKLWNSQDGPLQLIQKHLSLQSILHRL